VSGFPVDVVALTIFTGRKNAGTAQDAATAAPTLEYGAQSEPNVTRCPVA